MPALTLLHFMIFTACKGRAVELATAAVNVLLLHIKEFSCCCAHYCHCLCCCFSSSEPPLYARALYDFTARNNRELSITKGDLVQVKVATRWGVRSTVGRLPSHGSRLFLVVKQVVKRSSHWWLIRNRGEEGSVPQNVLELMSGSPVEEEQVSRAEPSQPPQLCGLTSRQVSLHLHFATVEPPWGRRPGGELDATGGQGLVGEQGLLQNVSDQCDGSTSLRVGD